jgi:ankyrin repeat protein
MEEEEPPILEPAEDVVGDRSGKKLLYTRKDGMLGSIFFDPNSVQLTSTRAVVSPYGTNEEYAILLKRILNLEVLTREVKQFAAADAEEEPPILEPNQFIVGSRSGKELLYTRKDGSRGVIYFDPNSVQLTPTRAVISPFGTNEEYAILRNKILNPEVLDEILAVPDPSRPWASAEFEPGMRVIIKEVPLDSYEAAQIMRKLKPNLGPFEILEDLKYKHETILQGYDEPQAKDIKEDLEDAGCTVYLQSIIPERDPQPGPLVAEPAIQIARPPTETEFALIRNARDNQYDSIKALVESAPLELNARDQAGRPLIFRMRSPKIVGLLIDHGADIHAQDTQGNTILHQGAMQKDVCQMLIQFGIDIDARGEGGHTPLTRAAQLRLYPLTKTLTEQGADIHSKNDLGENALQLAERHQDTEGNKIAALLHKYGAGPQPTPQSKRSPTEDEFYEIRCAENSENFFKVDELFKTAQIDINACDQLGNPIFFQVRSPEILGLLMDQGVDIHSNNASKENALHYCHREVSPDVCEMLIQFGVDINAVDDQGETPLIRAAAMGNYPIAKKLIEHGANINHRTPYGETALLAAENNQWKNKSQSTNRSEDCPKIAALLRENGAT